MKTKELKVGESYAVRRGNFRRAFTGVLLATDIKYIRSANVATLPGSEPGHNRVNTARPADKALGERGGLPFAVKSFNGVWVPVVIQPGNVFAQSEEYEAAVEAKRAADDAVWQARRDEQERQFQEQQAQIRANHAQWEQLNEALVARGLPEVIHDRHHASTVATVDVDFVQQVIRRLKVKS